MKKGEVNWVIIGLIILLLCVGFIISKAQPHGLEVLDE